MTKKWQKRTTRSDIPSEIPIRIMPWWWAVIATATSLLFGAGAWFIVWSIAKNDAPLKIDAIKIGLSVTAGVGAASGLLLAFRRQIHNEYVAQGTAFDATQRRVTELYAKAVEQLGNDKAAVRLGGLYALERLGQENPNHRQTVIDVVCAYLRMPYVSSPTTAPTSDTKPLNHPSPFPVSIAQDIPQQELLVLIAAQQMLARHLEDPQLAMRPVPYWEGVRIDLRGARLMSADFSGCKFYYADFTDVVFIGDTLFEEASFVLDGNFTRARFDGDVRFGAEFDKPAIFEGAYFGGMALFDDAIFDDDGIFEDARFHGNAYFRRARFKVTIFEKARFDDIADFRNAFFLYVTFASAQFTSPPDLTGVTTPAPLVRPTVWPDGWIAVPSGGDESNLRLVPANSENQTAGDSGGHDPDGHDPDGQQLPN